MQSCVRDIRASLHIIKVTAPVCASFTLSPACLMRKPDITRWMTLNTSVTKCGCEASMMRSGMGNEITLGNCSSVAAPGATLVSFFATPSFVTTTKNNARGFINHIDI